MTKQLFPGFVLGNRSNTMDWQNGSPETPVIDVELFCNIC